MSQSSLIGHSVLALKYVWHSCKLAVRLGQKISAHALCCDKKNLDIIFSQNIMSFYFSVKNLELQLLQLIHIENINENPIDLKISR